MSQGPRRTTGSGIKPLATLRITGGALTGLVLPVYDLPSIIGRGEDNEIVLPGEQVSHIHARLDARDGAWYLADLGSTHGTFLHGRRLTGETRLPAEAAIRMGAVELVFEPIENAGWRGHIARRSTGKMVLIDDIEETTEGSRLKEWFRRYWLAEIVGTLSAFGGSWLLDRLTGNPIAAAYGGSIGESIGFYGVITLKQMVADAHAAGTKHTPYDAAGALRTTRAIFMEFGPAELIDGGLLRPLLMGLGTRLFGRELGILAGKLLSDVAFYLPVIVAYEMGKKKRMREEEDEEEF
jgi:hypothetical protein